MAKLTFFVFPLTIILAACQITAPSDDDAAAGAWGGPASLEEELRFGELESVEEAYMLGRVQELAPDGDGGVYVFDGSVPAIRHFDRTGTYVRTIGGKGSGPGEYQDVLLGMQVMPDGNLIVRDPRNRRFSVYGPDGAPVDQWDLNSGLFTARAMYVDRVGNVYARELIGRIEPNVPPEFGLLRFMDNGTRIDTVHVPVMDTEPSETGWTFSIDKEWDFHPDGYMIVGVTDEYAIELRKPTGTVMLRRDLDRVPVGSDERAEWEAIRNYMNETRRQFMPQPIGPTPEVKPYYRSVYAGSDGSIWVHRYVEAVKQEPDPTLPPPAENDPPRRTWVEPAVYDVFRDDGTFLGEVRVPSGVSLYTFSLTTLWATETGEQGETIVVKYALKPG